MKVWTYASVVVALVVACTPGSPANAPTNGPDGPTCDGSGTCNIREAGCVRCAYEGVCKKLFDACQASPKCGAYIECAKLCQGLERDARKQCDTRCETEHATGYEGLYRPMAKCAFCEVCAKDCQLSPAASLCK